jgi:hypothetical protein
MKKQLVKRKLKYKKSAMGRIKEVEAENYNPKTNVKKTEKFVRKGIAGKEETTELQNLTSKKKVVRKLKTGIGRPSEVEITKYGRKGKKKKHKGKKRK